MPKLRSCSSLSIIPLLVGGLIAAFSQSLPSQGAVSPANRATYEGNTSTTYPLGRHNMRLQTLHADVAGLTALTGHGYRRDSGSTRDAVNGYTLELEVTVSTSPLTPDTASRTFADNVGTDAVVVLPRSFVTMPATNRPGLDPAALFDLSIPWVRSFPTPSAGATLCVDITVFGNDVNGNLNRNFSPYVDAHQIYQDGRSRHDGFRYGQGCAAPGSTALAYSNFDMIRANGSIELTIAARNGVPDDGSMHTMPIVMFGHGATTLPLRLPGGRQCDRLTTSNSWVMLPGNNDGNGRFDSSITGIPLAMEGVRIFVQSGSFDWNSMQLVLGDGSSLVAPPAAPATIPAVRIASGSDRGSATGTLSYSVPVMRFF